MIRIFPPSRGRGRSAPLRQSLLIVLFLAAATGFAQAPQPTDDPGSAPAESVPTETAPAAASESAATDEPSEPAAPATAVAPAANPTPAQADPAAASFLRLCSGCHTIGGGVLTGPDLLPSTKWQRSDLRIAVKRMEKNVGPLTDQEVDGLTDLLLSPQVQAKLDQARQQRVEEMAAALEPGVPATGRRLFHGEQRLAAGGIGCFACHAAAGRGGNMAKDLTTAFLRMGEQSVLSTTQQPAFPMMKAAYAARPVSAQEAVHLASFLKETSDAVPAGTAPEILAESAALTHSGAAVLVLAVLAGVAVLARSRRAGVRARMVRDSFRR